MSLLDILNKSKQAEAEQGEPSTPKKSPFALSTSFMPLRLAGKSDQATIDLLIELQNTSQETHLCSIVIEVPNGIGFEGVGLHKTKELRLGQLPAGERKTVPVTLHGSYKTLPGTYRLNVSVYSHYRDYSHVLNSVSKAVELRVV